MKTPAMIEPMNSKATAPYFEYRSRNVDPDRRPPGSLSGSLTAVPFPQRLVRRGEKVVDVAFAMRQRQEKRLERGWREVEAARQHAVEERPEGCAIEAESRDDLVEDQQRAARARRL